MKSAMKSKTPTNNNEVIVPDDKILVSKTDTKGDITYANSTFCTISGFSESELLGHHHNIVRHPDMPRVIFKILWDSLNVNREFNGYIKNLTKDGNYYWVFANVTPNFSDESELVGFYSVRRKPDPEKLNYIKNLYADLLDIEQQSSGSDSIQKSQYKLDSILNANEKGYDEFILTI